jgi:hypothetical protein
VVNASAITTPPVSNAGFVHLDMRSCPGADPLLIGPHRTRATPQCGHDDVVDRVNPPFASVHPWMYASSG